MPFDGRHYVDTRATALIAARERIARGWCQKWLEDERKHWWQLWRPKMSYCALGAINEYTDLMVVLLHALGIPLGDYDDIAAWNDAPERTQQDVLALFDRAIESLR